jgi:transcriptional regulator GlxA family with amidase domain
MELTMTQPGVPSAAGSRPRQPSVLRRIAHLVIGVALGTATLLAVLLGGVAKGMVVSGPPAVEGVLPAGRPSSNGPIVVAVVLGRSGTDAADALAPYEVFARSGRFSVYTVAATRGPAPLNGGPYVVPTYDFAAVSSGVARKPDLVVVPAVNDPSGEQESELRAWIVQQARTGARILGICAGSRVLAATGLLDGHRATSHWSRIAPLRKSNPKVTWVEGQRYVDDGPITTSAGVSSGIPASLHLMQELAGPAEAAKVVAQVRYPGWAPEGPTAIPIQHFSRGDAGVGLNAVLPWFQPTLAVGLADGVGEIDATALFDVYSYSSAARLISVSTGSSITTAHGVVILTTPAAALRQRASRLVLPGAHSETELAPPLRTLATRQGLTVTPLGQANTSGFDAALTDLASGSGTAITRSTAKMVDYPTRPTAPDHASPAVRAPILFALAVVLAATAGMTPTAIRVLRRRPRNRSHA